MPKPSAIEVGTETNQADNSRRRFLNRMAQLTVGGVGSIIANQVNASTPGSIEYAVPKDPTKVQGREPGLDMGYGTRSQFETETRLHLSAPNKQVSVSFTPLQNSRGIITPSGLHFERHYAGIPTIDPNEHQLFIYGLVDSPQKFSIDALKRFPSQTRTHFIECSGNSYSEWRKPTKQSVQETHGLMSCSEWTGVLLSTVLKELGVKKNASWMLAQGRDASSLIRSIPIEKVWDDAMLVYAQNGEAIRPEQGYPLRLLLPGFEGNANVKWLHSLKFTDQPMLSRWETSHYSDLYEDGKSRLFSLTMDAKSVVTFPSAGMHLDKAGFYEITGLAWTGRGRVKTVEVSVDDGKTWQQADLQEPLLSNCHTRFKLPWEWNGEPAVIQSRCTDETGYVQPTVTQLIAERGLNSFYHQNGIQSWVVDKDGYVSNTHRT